MTQPNFILAGVPKAGTTSLFHYLAQHPQVYMSPIKEPTFFAAAELVRPEFAAMQRAIAQNRASARAFMEGPMDTTMEQGLVLEWEHYLRLFRNVTTETAVGEASVTYFWAPSAAAAIRARLPEAKLLFMLRDPAERLFSHFLAALSSSPRKSFRALFDDAVRGHGAWTTVLDAGRYGSNLARFFAEFPAEQLRVWLYDDFRADPSTVMRQIFSFLRVAPDHPVDFRRRHNQPAVPRFAGLHELRLGLLGRRPLLARLPAPLRRFAQRIYRRPRGELTMDPADRQAVIDYYREETLRASALTGKDLSAWLR